MHRLIWLILIWEHIFVNCENWAVIVSTSRYWFNYRHAANSLSVYAILKELGISDNNIILMNSVNVACDSRNIYQGSIYNSIDTAPLDLCEGVETDYSGDEVTVNNFINLLVGRYDNHLPINKRLLSDKHSNVLLYMSGHGGNEFFKFNDNEELAALEFQQVLYEMNLKKRYKELLIILDTCQASTMSNYFHNNTENIYFIASSMKGENSYSYQVDETINVALIDRFSYGFFEYFKQNFRKIYSK